MNSIQISRLLCAVLLSLACHFTVALSQTQPRKTDTTTGIPRCPSLSGVEAKAEVERLSEQFDQLVEKGKKKEALLLLDCAQTLDETIGEADPAGVADVFRMAGTLYEQQGEYELAEDRYLRSLKIREGVFGPLHGQVAEVLVLLGNLYEDKQETLKAEAMYERALPIQEKEFGPNDIRIADLLNSLAATHFSREDYPRADTLWRRALRIREAAGESSLPGVANVLNNLGVMYFHLGNFKEAVPLSERALSIQERVFGVNSPETAEVLCNLGSSYQAENKYDRAEPLLLRSVAIMEKAWGKDYPDLAHPLTSLAWIYKARGDYPRVRQMLERALELQLTAREPDDPLIVEMLGHLADIYEVEGDITKAVATQIKAGEARERNLARMLTIGSEQQKRRYMGALLHGINATISLHASSAPNNPDATRLALTTIFRRKGRLLEAMTDQVGALRARLDPKGRELFDKLSSVRGQLAAPESRRETGQRPQSSPALRVKLAAEAERLEAEISARNAEFRIESKPVTIELVQQAIPADGVLIEFVVYRPLNVKSATQGALWGPEHYAAYLLRQTGAPMFVELGEAQPINNAARRLRVALRNSATNEVKDAARQMDELVMRPLRKLMGRAQLILLSPDGALSLIPFSALIDQEGQFLAERYTINYLGSGRDLLRLGGGPQKKQEVIIFADPTFDWTAKTAGHAAELSVGASGRRSVDFKAKSYEELPGTAAEARDIRNIFPAAKVFSKSQATEARLKQVSAPSILHVATHGFFEEDQPQTEKTQETTHETSMRMGLSQDSASENTLLRSGLVLAGVQQLTSGAGEDGVLTALEAASLNLWGTKLVVLSACETGLGEVQNSEGVYGLRRALVLAGSETQVMSLWKVDDSVTHDMMIAYYTRLKDGEGRSEALRQVQLSMLRSDKYRHPYFWASFIPLGNWRNLAGQEK